MQLIWLVCLRGPKFEQFDIMYWPHMQAANYARYIHNICRCIVCFCLKVVLCAWIGRVFLWSECVFGCCGAGSAAPVEHSVVVPSVARTPLSPSAGKQKD